MSEQAEVAFCISKVSCDTEALNALSERILTRDRNLLEGARFYWLQNGCDLIKAKALAGHGRFETWCKDKLSYSKSKAEKLMRAAEMFEPLLESINVTDLPRPTVFYTLSAPSVPQVIRDEFIPRVLAKEPGVASELKKAIGKHRKNENAAVRCGAKSPEAQAAREQREAAEARREAREAERRRTEQERQTTARSAALALVLARLGDELPILLALVAEAGSAKVFSDDTERELQVHARAMAALQVNVEAGIVTEMPEAVDAETYTELTVSDSEKFVQPSRLETADKEQVIAPTSDEPVFADLPADTAKVSPLASAISLLGREQPLKFNQSRGQVQTGRR